MGESPSTTSTVQVYIVAKASASSADNLRSPYSVRQYWEVSIPMECATAAWVMLCRIRNSFSRLWSIQQNDEQRSLH